MKKWIKRKIDNYLLTLFSDDAKLVLTKYHDNIENNFQHRIDAETRKWVEQTEIREEKLLRMQAQFDRNFKIQVKDETLKLLKKYKLQQTYNFYSKTTDSQIQDWIEFDEMKYDSPKQKAERAVEKQRQILADRKA